MGRVGLVLGGGGISGAAYEMAALMAIRLATGWDPNQAEVIVGTSAGAFVAGQVRSEALHLDSLVLHADSREDVAIRIRQALFTRQPGVNVGQWVRHGIIPGVINPGLTFLLGSPAPFSSAGVGRWLQQIIGDAVQGWPDKPTVVTAFDVAAKKRMAFGTEGAPDVALADAVSASSAIPLIFRPFVINGRQYVDGGIVSGTHADLVLGLEPPLDLVLIVAPMAASEERRGAWFHERMFDRVGRSAIDEETEMIRQLWPGCEILVLRPSALALAAMRPNPMDPNGAVPTFMRTLTAMRRTLAQPAVWEVLQRHLMVSKRRT